MSGYKGFFVEPWFGFQVPQGTPKEVVQTLNSAFNASVQKPAIKKRLEEAGVRVVAGVPEKLGDQISSEYERWAKVVKDNNIKAE